NLRSKGGDGFTPLGPDLIPASEVAPTRLRVRTWLDGELVQDDTSETLLFDLGLLIADLSRVMTLEEGDVILTGTPAGASVAQPGQVIEVEVSTDNHTSGRLRTEVVEGPELGAWGSQPKVDATVRADAWGKRLALDPDMRARLNRVAVATLSSQLRKRGYDAVSIDGVHPLVPGQRLVGTARTLRFVPYRPDLFASHGGGYNAQKRAMDTIDEGEVLVIEARQDPTNATLADILAHRALVRGAAG
ncbi:fumarylacetoacetate hydrolase family protein, partial [Kibdelosporangium lantanae]